MLLFFRFQSAGCGKKERWVYQFFQITFHHLSNSINFKLEMATQEGTPSNSAACNGFLQVIKVGNEAGNLWYKSLKDFSACSLLNHLLFHD